MSDDDQAKGPPVAPEVGRPTPASLRRGARSASDAPVGDSDQRSKPGEAEEPSDGEAEDKAIDDQAEAQSGDDNARHDQADHDSHEDQTDDESLQEDAEDQERVPDLVVGLVGAVGTDLPWVEEQLVTHLGYLAFDAEIVSLSGLMDREYGGALHPRDSVPYDYYVNEHMTAGNALRAHWKRPDALALIAVEEIRRRRDGRPPDGRPFAVVLRSLKRPEEMRLLQEVYRGQFVAIGCHTPRETRLRQLSDSIARTRAAGAAAPHRARAEDLAHRDEHEHGAPTDDPRLSGSSWNFGGDPGG